MAGEVYATVGELRRWLDDCHGVGRLPDNWTLHRREFGFEARDPGNPATGGEAFSLVPDHAEEDE